MLARCYNHLSRSALLASVFSFSSCEKQATENKIFETQKILLLAEISVAGSLEAPHLAEELRRSDTKPTLVTLREFHQFAGTFGSLIPNDRDMVDGWGKPLRFAFNDDHAEVWSAGPDEIDQSGKGDDIKSEIRLKPPAAE
jgi:hypothetical protein